ncbi:MAG: transposase [Kofleriaceae bacterium]|nr:transposase [Kofleriaceae bacterium]
MIDSDDRDGLERLCRYGASSPIANSRLALLKRRYFDGRTQLKFAPAQFLQKLALLIPPPWKNLTRYHGVFAPNHTHRADITSSPAIRTNSQISLISWQLKLT